MRKTQFPTTRQNVNNPKTQRRKTSKRIMQTPQQRTTQEPWIRKNAKVKKAKNCKVEKSKELSFRCSANLASFRFKRVLHKCPKWFCRDAAEPQPVNLIEHWTGKHLHNVIIFGSTCGGSSCEAKCEELAQGWFTPKTLGSERPKRCVGICSWRVQRRTRHVATVPGRFRLMTLATYVFLAGNIFHILIVS